MDSLFETIQQRQRPRQVAVLLLAEYARYLSAGSQAQLQTEARVWQSVDQTDAPLSFHTPHDVTSLCTRLNRWFPNLCPAFDPFGSDTTLEKALQQARTSLGVAPTTRNPAHHRDPHNPPFPARSRRQQRRCVRGLLQLETKIRRRRKNKKLTDLFFSGFSGMVNELSRTQLRRDPATAAFVAFYAARCHKQAVPGPGPSYRPFNTAAYCLLETCLSQTEPDWFAIAHVYPQPDILARLTPYQLGFLTGRWYRNLREVAWALQCVAPNQPPGRKTKAGSDTATWNRLVTTWRHGLKTWSRLQAAGDDHRLVALPFGIQINASEMPQPRRLEMPPSPWPTGGTSESRPWRFFLKDLNHQKNNPAGQARGVQSGDRPRVEPTMWLRGVTEADRALAARLEKHPSGFL